MSNQFHVHTDTHPYGLALPWALAGIYWKCLSWGVLQRWFDLIVSIVWILFTFRWTWDRLEITQQQVEETSSLENRRYVSMRKELPEDGAARHQPQQVCLRLQVTEDATCHSHLGPRASAEGPNDPDNIRTPNDLPPSKLAPMVSTPSWFSCGYKAGPSSDVGSMLPPSEDATKGGKTFHDS